MLTIQRLLVAAGVTALLFGCRSTGTLLNPPSGGDIVTVDESASVPAAVAYKTGVNGTWKLLASGRTTFNVPGGGPYGVAFVCGEEEPPSIGKRTPQSAESQVDVVQATTSEITTVPVPCGEEATASLSGTYDTSAIASANEVDIDGNNYDAGTGTYAVSVVPGTQDIVATVWSESAVLAVKTVQGVDVPAAGLTNEAITVASTDAVGANQTISWTNQPGDVDEEDNEVDFGELSGVTLPLIENGETTSIAYPTVAAADIGPNDEYHAYEDAYLDSEESGYLVEGDAYGQTLPTSVALPDAFNETDPATSSVRPAFTLNYSGYSSLSGGISGYEYGERWDGTTEGAVYGIVSAGFLRAAGTAFTAPNITLAGFSSMQAAEGDSLEWYVAAFYATGFGFSDLLGAGIESAAQRNPQSSPSRAIPKFWGGARTQGVRAQSSSTSAESGYGYWAEASGCYTVGGSEGC
jgi:hypothetical protein